MRDDNKQTLMDELLCNCKLFLPDDHPQLSELTSLQLFQELCDGLSERHPDENHDLEMLSVEGGWLLTVAGGDPTDIEPDFSPPEPSFPW